MSGKTSPLRSPLAKVRGLGSAKDGTGHWWWQRVTAIGLIPLTMWFVYVMVTQIAVGDRTVIAAYFADPIHAILMLGLVITMVHHGRLGVQVIVEDYVHCECAKPVLMMANTFVFGGLAVCSLFSILKLHFFGI